MGCFSARACRFRPGGRRLGGLGGGPAWAGRREEGAGSGPLRLALEALGAGGGVDSRAQAARGSASLRRAPPLQGQAERPARRPATCLAPPSGGREDGSPPQDPPLSRRALGGPVSAKRLGEPSPGGGGRPARGVRAWRPSRRACPGELTPRGPLAGGLWSRSAAEHSPAISWHHLAAPARGGDCPGSPCRPAPRVPQRWGRRVCRVPRSRLGCGARRRRLPSGELGTRSYTRFWGAWAAVLAQNARRAATAGREWYASSRSRSSRPTSASTRQPGSALFLAGRALFVPLAT